MFTKRSLVRGLRLAASKVGVAEEAVSFLVEVDQLRQAVDSISPAAAGALSKPRLRLARASATNIADRFMADQSRFNLPVNRRGCTGRVLCVVPMSVKASGLVTL